MSATTDNTLAERLRAATPPGSIVIAPAPTGQTARITPLTELRKLLAEAADVIDARSEAACLS